jgi:predicted lipid carrier protein YhbT
MATGLPAPVHVMRAGLRALPPPLIGLALRRLTAALPRNHAPLLKRLGRMAPASILFAPTDVPHRFVLRIAAQGVALVLARQGTRADVTMRGSLATLLALLESRVDSDTVFFSRDLSVTGDTGVALAFRNTLDGEAINLIDDALSRLGPLTAPAGRAAERLHGRIDRMLGRLAALREAAHRDAHGGHDPRVDRGQMLASFAALAARVEKLEARGKSQRGAA